MARASFARDKQAEPGFEGRIANLFWTIKKFDNGNALTLNLDREGSQWTQYYSTGRAVEGMRITHDGYQLEAPDDFTFSPSTAGARMLNTLMDACDKAKVEYNPEDLSSFVGLDVVWVNEPRPTKARPDKTIPVARSVEITSEWVQSAHSAAHSEAPEAPNQAEEAVKVLHAILAANGGEMDLSEIDSKMVKPYTNGADYATRKAIADLVSDPEWCLAQNCSVDGQLVRAL